MTTSLLQVSGGGGGGGGGDGGGGKLIIKRPEEGAHSEVSLVSQVAVGGQAVLAEKGVELPLRHVLVVLSGKPGVVERHLEEAISVTPAIFLPLHFSFYLHSTLLLILLR